MRPNVTTRLKGTARRFAPLLAILATAGAPARTNDGAQCKASGGALLRRGLLGSPMCVIAFRDAGKSCRGKADCRGKCLAAPGQADVTRAVGASAKGICQAENTPFGCFAEVEHGRLATRLMCTD